MLSVNLLSRGWSVLQAEKLLQPQADGLFWRDTFCIILYILYLHFSYKDDAFSPESSAWRPTFPTASCV